MFTRFMAWIFRTFSGWRFEGEIPERPCVCIATPHTSNWDGIWLVALASEVRIKLSWMVKVSAVRWPWAWLLKRLGAVPIDRSKRENTVSRMIRAFEEDRHLVLVVPPSGTRRKTEQWKSGFYHIALGAQVPVVPGYLDYKRKRGGFGPAITMTGDPVTDMNAIRSFYDGKAPPACYPDLVSPMRLREEMEADPPSPPSEENAT